MVFVCVRVITLLKCMIHYNVFFHHFCNGWSGGAMVLDKLPNPRRPTSWIIVGQGPTALAVRADWGWCGHFF